ncbi:hypothetical protein B0H34DRAFT_671934 [Crassisporium funariophilum]|nr:hypothetical protein B0H34DRAFT_671934 [Crassisporium funariophilum]
MPSVSNIALAAILAYTGSVMALPVQNTYGIVERDFADLETRIYIMDPEEFDARDVTAVATPATVVSNTDAAAPTPTTPHKKKHHHHHHHHKHGGKVAAAATSPTADPAAASTALPSGPTNVQAPLTPRDGRNANGGGKKRRHRKHKHHKHHHKQQTPPADPAAGAAGAGGAAGASGAAGATDPAAAAAAPASVPGPADTSAAPALTPRSPLFGFGKKKHVVEDLAANKTSTDSTVAQNSTVLATTGDAPKKHHKHHKHRLHRHKHQHHHKGAQGLKSNGTVADAPLKSTASATTSLAATATSTPLHEIRE